MCARASFKNRHDHPPLIGRKSSYVLPIPSDPLGLAIYLNASLELLRVILIQLMYTKKMPRLEGSTLQSERQGKDSGYIRVNIVPR